MLVSRTDSLQIKVQDVERGSDGNIYSKYWENPNNNEAGGDVVYANGRHRLFTIHDDSERINKKSEQHEFDNRPAHVELCYLIYLGV